jgi:DNA/RNA endonuclease G (NUC1)
MINTTNIYRFASAVLVIFSLFLSSCDKPQVKEEVLQVSINTPVVACAAGEQYVRVKCSGGWTLTLQSDGGDVDWARLNMLSGTGNKSVELSYDANNSGFDRKLTIVLESGINVQTCTMTQLAAGDASGDGGDLAPEMPSSDLAKTGWLELPALNDSELGYFSHSFKMNGKTYRNYSFGWSQKDMVAVWVAYPLCKMYSNGSVKRADAEVWALDPHLGNDSSAPFGGYGGNYDRGHQLPFADRKCCLEAAKQTFYGTNMTPQDNGLNTGVWEAFESKVRSWAASSDTTYVVTGCTLDKPLGYTTDSYGKKMTVPSGYFKAILKYSKSSTLGQWNAAGFYYKHESGAKQQMMSIDQLEEMTGIDFFVNLSAKIGADQAVRLEAAIPSTSVWQ